MDKKKFQALYNNLEKARTNLKEEFIGLNDIIDEIIDLISGWYLFNELQEKPLTINLWGITGTGKSSLVKKLVEYLKYQDRFYVNEGNGGGERPRIRSIMENVDEKCNGESFIVLVDEFQHYRTLNEQGQESKSLANADLWEFLDTGSLPVMIDFMDSYHFNEFLYTLKLFIEKGLRSKNGRITRVPDDKEELINLSQFYQLEKGKELITGSVFEKLFQLIRPQVKSASELDYLLQTFDEEQCYEFMMQAYSKDNFTKIVDGSKALVFIAGNLDESLKDGLDIRHEMDANFLSRKMKEISPIDIKNALKKRFRNEQIARLGNHHIIYPTLDNEGYKDLIKIKLTHESIKFFRKTGLKLSFTENFTSKIYEEGVQPSQGIRPVISVIGQWVSGNFSKLLMPLYSYKLAADSIQMDYQPGQIIITYFNLNKSILADRITLKSRLDILKKDRNNELRAITSIHEAGHTVLSVVLLKTLPKYATSLSLNVDSSGYVKIERPQRYKQSDLLEWLAFLLAGGEAEKLMLGADHLPLGAQGDYEKATSIITEYLKTGILGEVPAYYSNRDMAANDRLHDDENELTKLAIKWLTSAKKMAKECLTEHKDALKSLAGHLHSKDYMNDEDIKSWAIINLAWESKMVI